MHYESGGPARISPKSSPIDLEAYFFEVLENYDEDRVYASDIKKILQWYNLLVGKKILTLPKAQSKKTKKEGEKSTNKKEK